MGTQGRRHKCNCPEAAKTETAWDCPECGPVEHAPFVLAAPDPDPQPPPALRVKDCPFCQSEREEEEGGGFICTPCNAYF